MSILSISAILFYKNIKKGRYLFNMITTNIDIELTDNYDRLFKLADTIVNNIIDEIDEEFPNWDTIKNENFDENKDYGFVKNDKLKNEDDTTDNTLYHVTGKTLKALAELLDNKENYSGLFDSINTEEDTEENNDNHIRINSLAEYFGVLKILGNIHPRFIRLPLDENYYSINANERTIIPMNNTPRFAVKGDHSAEVIYFKINRYFDAMDLGAATIIIQSQIGNQKFVTPINLIDLDSEPDYIIFGWPINQLITMTTGNLSFAVRFYVYEGTEIKYSFGTLTQTLPIRDSLYWFDNGINADVDNPPIIDNSGIYLKNFVIKGSTTIAKPVFNASDCSELKFYSKDSIVTAKATSNGADITYQWKKDDKKGNNNSYVTVSSNENDDVSSCTLGGPGDYYCIATAHVGINEETQSYGPYQVKAPCKYKFLEGNNAPLNQSVYVWPSDQGDTLKLTDFLSSSSTKWCEPEKDNNNNYVKGIYLQMENAQFDEGTPYLENISKPTSGTSTTTNITIKNTVNGDTSVSTNQKEVTIYLPLENTLSRTTTYKTTSDGRKEYTITIISPSNGYINSQNANSLFTVTYEWAQQEATTGNWSKITTATENTYTLPSGANNTAFGVKVILTLKPEIGYKNNNTITSGSDYIRLSTFTEATS